MGLMKTSATVALTALLVVPAVVGIVLVTGPPTYEIERSVTIAAPPELVLEHVTSYRSWSPWVTSQHERRFHGMDSALMNHCTTVSVSGRVGDDTILTWRRSGRHGFGQLVSALIGTDWIVGDELERGLAELKRVVEAEASRREEPAAP